MNRASCPICLDAASDESGHVRCREELFGTRETVTIDLDTARLHTLALATVGTTTMSGVQRQLSAGLDRNTLTLRVGKGSYILKPPTDSFPGVPENEHLTMVIASAVGIPTPSCGLVRMADGKHAYIVQRFDRGAAGLKLYQEDFCQLMELEPRDKYGSSAERCAKVVEQYTSEPGIQRRELFRYFLFSWWCGNGDLHLKNLSLTRDGSGKYEISPAYDLLCTRLHIPGDQLALPVQGKRGGLKRETWRRFAESIELPQKAMQRVVDELLGTLPRARELVEQSYISAEHQQIYRELLEERSEVLRA